jgi:cytochrome c oxidase subunit 3
MALAVHSAETDRRKSLITYLFLTIVLGLIFLGIKSFEYHAKFVEHLVPGSLFKFEESQAAPAEIFFSLYFAMTGMHAVHMIIGIGLMTALILQTRRGRFSISYHTPVELTGLYWHFVDIVWIFLFPLLYLLGRHV